MTDLGANPVDDLWSGEAVWAVGRFTVDGRTVLWPSTRAERAYAAAHAARHLGSLGITDGALVVLVSLMSQGVQMVPVEDAVAGLGAALCPVDATALDANRLASLLGQFPVRAVLGVGPATLDGLQQLGVDLSVFAGVPVVVAEPAAASTLEAAGQSPFRWQPVGPSMAIECPHRQGLHLDGESWDVSVDGGHVVLRPRWPGVRGDRGALATGVRAVLLPDVCPCGAGGPRLAVGEPS